MDKKKTEEQLREERRHELIFPTLAAGYMRGYVARNGRGTSIYPDFALAAKRNSQ